MKVNKYRAWDNHNKKMYDFGKLMLVINTFSGQDKPEALSTNILYIGDCTVGEIWDDLIILQYIGLKDKNAVEIFEGDIVRLHCFNDNLITATIEWSDNRVGFCPRIHNKKIIVDGGTSHGKKVSMRTVHSWAGMHSCFSYPRYMEIIGNVYENSELLKEVK